MAKAPVSVLYDRTWRGPEIQMPSDAPTFTFCTFVPWTSDLLEEPRVERARRLGDEHAGSAAHGWKSRVMPPDERDDPTGALDVVDEPGIRLAEGRPGRDEREAGELACLALLHLQPQRQPLSGRHRRQAVDEHEPEAVQPRGHARRDARRREHDREREHEHPSARASLAPGARKPPGDRRDEVRGRWERELPAAAGQGELEIEIRHANLQGSDRARRAAARARERDVT